MATLTVDRRQYPLVNRRTLLGGIAGASTVGLAGCADRVLELSMSLPIIVNVENETDVERNVTITAHEIDTNRQTFDEAVSAPTESTATLGRLPNDDAQVVVELMAPTTGEDSPDDGDAEIVDVEETLVGESTQSLTIYITDDGLELELAYR